LHIYSRNDGGPGMLFVEGNNDAFITVWIDSNYKIVTDKIVTEHRIASSLAPVKNMYLYFAKKVEAPRYFFNSNIPSAWK
jgi:hypothetical protein